MTLSADTRNRLSYGLASSVARDEIAAILDFLTPNTAATVMALSQLLAETSAAAVTAFATGGQTNATPITTEIARVSTVASAADSVKLPASVAGLTIIVINSASNAVQVFGAGTDTINGVATATGVSQMPSSVVVYVCPVAGSWFTEGIGTGFSGSFQTQSVKDGLVALAGGAQAGTALTAMINRVVTVASGADSVQLPASTPGMSIVVVNAAAANSMNVFPQTGDAINALSANTALAVAANKTATFYCTAAGRWHSILTA